tara:strand:+ start:4350 stop:4550 length:201 start_codon:yes stop_codon:yes gene_type:complete
MDDMVFFESLKIAEWKTKKFQSMYDSTLEELIGKFIKHVEDNKYGQIDIKNKSITITYSDVSRTTE